jgi:hypothetical protein
MDLQTKLAKPFGIDLSLGAGTSLSAGTSLHGDPMHIETEEEWIARTLGRVSTPKRSSTAFQIPPAIAEALDAQRGQGPGGTVPLYYPKKEVPSFSEQMRRLLDRVEQGKQAHGED